ncbi:MFS monosaccharide transporter-like protein [Dacryopinax primogenitus]|uniref:MFS monosaccharide transporter-like protein n=1 Tax=Dacryopinax primogenitus (strain DJM 731) TaxID=1858805 RepID=M5G6Q9_DACPD|nr:MFS monosaccharide transporter-like protein [Dacryopinax primogenitus]EJU05941.1 MFS monosaccharide transporter-like protein [Dacryopinax primogenitus]
MSPSNENRFSLLLKHKRCMAACILISMSPFQYGIDFGLIGGLQAMVGFLKVFGYSDPSTPIGYNISSEVQQLISSLMTLGACVGSISAGPIGAQIGRRHALWAACVLCAVSDAIMLGTTNVGALYVGRLLIGIANGWFMTFSQLYLNEVAPAELRGLTLGFFQWWCSIGSLVGTIVDNYTAPIDGRASYMIPLALIYIVPVILAIGMIFVPESPRWLVSKGKIEEARASLLWLRSEGDKVEAELTQIKDAAKLEAETTKGVTFWDMFRNPIDRRRTLLSVMAVSVQGASGAMFMLIYGTYFFAMADVGQPFQNSCILSGVGCIAITLSFFLITRVGRRPLIIIGIFMSGVCQLAVAAVYQHAPGTVSTGKAIVGLSVVYIIFYNGCISAYAWLLGGEIPSQRLRSMTLGLSACVGFILGWLAAFTAPYFINPENLNWGPKYGYIWFPSCAVTAIALYIWLPETKDRSLEELDEMFAARVPAWRFKDYVCHGITLDAEGHAHIEKAGEGSGEETPDEKGSVEYIERAGNKA